MSTSLTVYPIAEQAYNAGMDATDHALKFRVGCPQGLPEKIVAMNSRPVEKLILNYDAGIGDLIINEDRYGTPLRAVNGRKLAKILRQYVTPDRQQQSSAVVAFLEAMDPTTECVPYFG